jgi:hypothetical protein
VFWLTRYLSPRVLGEVPELLSGARQVVHPRENLLLQVVLVPSQKVVTDHSFPSLIPRWLQGDCREWLRAKTDIKWMTCHAFLLLLVNSWAQEGVSAFQLKQFELFLQLPPYV